MVQGQVGPVVADHAARPDSRARRSRSRGGQARLRSDDADEKDRHRCDRSGPARLTLTEGPFLLAETAALGRFPPVRAEDRVALLSPRKGACYGTVRAATTHRAPWNKGKLVGQKAPFKLKEIWAI